MKKICIILGWIVLILGAIILFFFAPTENKIKRTIKIGYSDDTSSFIVNYMRKQKNFKNASIKKILEPTSIRDC